MYRPLLTELEKEASLRGCMCVGSYRNFWIFSKSDNLGSPRGFNSKRASQILSLGGMYFTVPAAHQQESQFKGGVDPPE